METPPSSARLRRSTSTTTYSARWAPSQASLCKPWSAQWGGAELIDEEDSDDGRILALQQSPVAQTMENYRYIDHSKACDYEDEEGTVPMGYTSTIIDGVHAFTNGCAKQGTAWYSDGSKLEVDTGKGLRQQACRAVTCRPLHVIGRT